MQKKLTMKKYLFTYASLIIAALLIFTSCDSTENKSEEKKDGVKVGKITKGTNTELTISLSDASKLMQEHNRLTKKWFNYTYTRAWIEVLQTSENKFSYYLGVKANLEGKNNEKAYSCYSVYSELEASDNELTFYPNAYQQSCLGKCCSNCKLVMFKNNEIGCQCESPGTESGCEGAGKCKHDGSRVLDDEQKKNDLI